MPTYIYVEKNGNATLTLSANDDDEAMMYLQSVIHDKDVSGWRLDDTLPDPDADYDYDDEEISLCGKCWCMTHTLKDGRCGKCKQSKDDSED